jgi:hypothetical protein
MTQAHHPKFPQTAVGSLYPTNYVVGVIDDLEEGRRAVQAFAEAGYDSSTVRLMDAQEALDKHRELEHRKNRFQRFFSGLQDATDETGAYVYRFEAREGHHILYVRACSSQLRVCSTSEVDQIRELMEQFHAHTIKFFSFWWVEDIPPRKEVRH